MKCDSDSSGHRGGREKRDSENSSSGVKKKQAGGEVEEHMNERKKNV